MEPAQFTQRQWKALDDLQSLDDEKVLTWLSLLQSLKPGYEHHSCPRGLSRRQLLALSILKDCAPDDVLTGLRQCRTGKRCITIQHIYIYTVCVDTLLQGMPHTR